MSAFDLGPFTKYLPQQKKETIVEKVEKKKYDPLETK
jgi:hypothetical protein